MTNEGGSIPEEWRNEYVSDRVHTAGTVFLGLTLECTRCHDHKYDPFTMKDYYTLGAFFNSIDEWGTYDSAAFRPTPTLALPTSAEEQTIAAGVREVEVRTARLRTVELDCECDFRTWLARNDLKPLLPGLVAYCPLDKLEAGNHISNNVDGKHPGSASSANSFVPGRYGKALRFTGDDPANIPAPASLDRAQPLTVSFWLQTPDVMKQAIVFHRQAGTDTGFHGPELTIDEGRLCYALVRFWPGNMAAIRARTPLPAKTWVHVTVSHDGSGRAAGMRIYIDGRLADVDVVRDCLTRNLDAPGGTLVFGERFRSLGLKSGLLDEVRIFDRALTDIEVAQLHDGRALADALARKDEAALRPYYLSAVDPEMAKARAELRQARQRLFAAETGVFDIMTMAEMPQARQAYILARGNYDAPKDRPVGRDTPASLPAFPSGAPRNRLGLARWLTNPHHPLTARVAVNRIWQMFFGRGIVATTENFGTQGALPTHPELLDWLARDFIASGWDVKALCRQVVLSSTYRQRSAATPELRERDPDNLLLARGPSRRLSAEELRDAALAAGGLLAQEIGGPPVKPYQPPGMWRGMNAFLPEYVPDKGEKLHRRSLYTYWRRTSPPPNMIAFDAPSREVCVVRRQTTSTPLQPLVLLNDPQFVEAARALAERMLREGGATPQERLTYAFRQATTRKPNERELRVLGELYEGQLQIFRSDAAAARRFLNTGERAPAQGFDPAELAAAATTAGAIMNLDAALATR
jgi:hypothetical protein